MSSRFQLYCIIALLTLIGGGGIIYKRAVVGYPLLPKQSVPVWIIEAHAEFSADGGPVKLSMAVPGEQPSLGLLQEEGISLGYGFTGPEEDQDVNNMHRRAVWARSAAEGKQRLFYRVTAYQKFNKHDLGPLLANPPYVDPVYAEEPLSTAVQAIIEDAQLHSADAESMASYLIGQCTQKEPPQNIRYVFQDKKKKAERAATIQQILLAGGVETHLIIGLVLGESAKRQSLVPALLVRTSKDWVGFLSDKPQAGLPEPFLAWQRGGASLVDLEGGKDASIRFSVMRDRRPVLDVIDQSAKKTGQRVTEFSIYNLPLEQQNAFRLLLMVPLGALVVVVLRNLVGIKTSGTFMPILLAMSFLQTQLITGLVIFLLVVGAGLLVRAYLSRLDLLLVPRISSVVVVVIGIMAAVSIVGNMLQLEFARSVTLFPTIILAWTVERLSVLWEEDGAREVAVQTGGSLFTAILCFFLMGSHTVQYMVFTFPEWLLLVLAVILLLGQYTGYRISELKRFSPLVEEDLG